MSQSKSKMTYHSKVVNIISKGDELIEVCNFPDKKLIGFYGFSDLRFFRPTKHTVAVFRRKK